MEAIAEAVLERQRGYLETRFDKLQQMGEDTEAKLGASQADLLSLTESIGSVKVELDKIRSDVGSNSGRLATQEATLETMQLKLTWRIEAGAATSAPSGCRRVLKGPMRSSS